MNDNTTTYGEMRPAYRPKLSFYHANAKGTGSALALELLPARGDTEGCIMATLANQLTVGNRNGPNPTYSRFDYENKITVKFGFTDLCKMLQVFHGECESIENGKGLYHSTEKFATRIALRHILEPVQCYALEVSRSTKNSEAGQQRVHFLLFPHEARGLQLAIENSMGYITFGIPTETLRFDRSVGQSIMEKADAPAA